MPKIETSTKRVFKGEDIVAGVTITTETSEKYVFIHIPYELCDSSNFTDMKVNKQAWRKFKELINAVEI